MIEFLYKNFKNFPVIGDPIKVAYVGSLIKDVLNNGKKTKSAKELSNLSGKELEDEIKSQATDMYNEYIAPEVSANNIPPALADPVKEKAIKEFSKKLREEIQKKAEKVIGIEEPKETEKEKKEE